MATVAEIPRLRNRGGASLRTRPRRAAARVRSAATGRARVPPCAGARPNPSREPSPSRDRGAALLIVFMSGTLAMVGLVRLIDIIDRAWILIAALAIYLVVIVAVLVSVLRVMDDDNGD